MSPESRTRVLFLTPFNFLDERNDDGFDALVQRQLQGQALADVVAAHVPRFEADDADYDAVQEQVVVESVRKAEADGYDAVVIACFYDPAVPAAREASSIPIIAPMQLLGSLATQFGSKFHVITDIFEAEEPTTSLIEGYGIGASCTGVTAIGIDGDTILADTRAAAKLADELIQQIAERGEARTIVIGCTIVSAAYEQHRHEFPDHGVRVLNSNRLSLDGASLLAAQSA